MRWSALFICVGAMLLIGFVMAVPQALVHIGPHKTASSYIQSSFHRISKELMASKFYWPAGGPKDVSAYWAALTETPVTWLERKTMKPEVELQKMINFLKMSLHHKRNIILSTEAFSLMEPEHIAVLKKHLAGFNTTIVFVYRDTLSHMTSLHFEVNRFETAAVKFSTSFSTFLMSTFDNLPITLQPLMILDRFSAAFGQQQIRIIDLAGATAAGRDVAHVMACETMGVLCNRPDLFRRNDTARNPSYSLIPAQVFSFYETFVSQHKRTFCGPLLSEYHYFESRYYNFTSVHDPPANFTSHLVPLRPFAEQVDRDLRAKYGSQILHGNQTANLESSRRAHVTELHLELFLQDMEWYDWIGKEYKLAQATGRICYHTALNHTSSK